MNSSDGNNTSRRSSHESRHAGAGEAVRKPDNNGRGERFSANELLSKFINDTGTKRNSDIIISIAVLLVFIVIFAFVLPRLEAFSNKVDVNAALSSTDVYFDIGESSAEVLNLQKTLFSLGVLDLNGVTGQYDENTLAAINKVLTSNGKAAVEECTLGVYDYIRGIAAGSVTTTASTTTTAATTTTAPTIKNIKIAAASTMLRQGPSKDTLALFMPLQGESYAYLEQTTDADGTVWYKVKYSDACNGWLISSDVECLYE